MSPFLFIQERSMKIFKYVMSVLMLCLVTNVYAQVENLFHKSSDPVIGNPKGSITIVEFFDYQCGYCKTMAPILDRIIKTNPQVRVVFKEFPIRGPVSDFAAAAALAANKQGKYHVFNNALLSMHGPLSEQSILALAAQNGLNIEKLKHDIHTDSIASQIQDNLRLADALQLNGTPAFFIGPTNARNMSEIKFIYGAMSESEIQREINRLSR